MMRLIPTPNGRFAFVGKVPAGLAYRYSNPEYLDIAAQSGPGVAAGIAKREGGTFEAITFVDRADAESAALEWAGSPEELAKHYMAAG
jgi:hypothetical protein